MDGITKLTDEMLDGVSGGVQSNTKHTESELEKAGVIVKHINGKTIYETRLSSGMTIKIQPNVAMGMCDCYKLSGGERLNDQQIQDLIAQS